MALPLVLACAEPPAGQVEAMVADAADPLPAVAPGLLLLAQLAADGTVSVGGTVQSELWVDVDTAHDDRDAFRYALLDADGATIYERTTPGPVIVRDFLDYYGESSGFELLELYPPLGAFPVMVPLLDGAAAVELHLRDDDGDYRLAGSYDLGLQTADDQGLADEVTDWATLWDSGPGEHRLDIALLGDGYTAEQQGQWQGDAEALAAAILEAEPFASYAGSINIHRVDAVSNESGASYDCVGECRTRDTVYQSVFPLELVNEVLGTSYRTSAIFQLDQWLVARAASVVPWDFVLVLANTEHSGGFAVHYASVARSGNWGGIAVHELAHVVGLLGDEYENDACIRTDALGLPGNIADDAENTPWAHWIDEATPLPTPESGEYREVVGAFEGAYNCDDLFRPQQTCRMSSSSSGEFCAACGELLTRRLFRYIDPATGVTVADTAGGLAFAVNGLHDDASVSWWLDGERVGEAATLTLADADWGGQSHALEVRTTASSAFVLEDGGDLAQSWWFDLR